MKKLLLLLLCCVIPACSTTPKVIYKAYLVQMEPSWLTPCPVAPPPNPSMYLRSTPAKREKLSAEAYVEQTSNVDQCNSQLEAIRKKYELMGVQTPLILTKPKKP